MPYFAHTTASDIVIECTAAFAIADGTTYADPVQTQVVSKDSALPGSTSRIHLLSVECSHMRHPALTFQMNSIFPPGIVLLVEDVILPDDVDVDVGDVIVLPDADEPVLVNRVRLGRTGVTLWRLAGRQRPEPDTGAVRRCVPDEHLRQHERVTRRDQGRLDRIREMTDPARPVTVIHWLTVSKRKPFRDRDPADTISQVDAHAGSRQTIRSVVGS